MALTVHVTSSVGWLGSVVAFLGLAVVGLSSQDAQTVRAIFLVMEPAAWFVIVPFASASLLTGVIQSLATPWGLVRHYWVLIKLLINVFASIVLLLYMRVLGRLADIAADTTLSSTDLGVLKDPSPVLHAVTALLLLVAATALSVFKPRGMTRYGRRKQHEERRASLPSPQHRPSGQPPPPPPRPRGEPHDALACSPEFSRSEADGATGPATGQGGHP